MTKKSKILILKKGTKAYDVAEKIIEKHRFIKECISKDGNLEAAKAKGYKFVTPL